MDYYLMAGDVLQLLDDLKIPKATLMGHSMGGRTMMAVSLLEVSRNKNEIKNIVFVFQSTSSNKAVWK